MLEIKEMFAFVALDEQAKVEGLISARVGGQNFPMVGADWKMVELLRPQAEEIAKQSGKTIKLLRFKTREEVEVIGG